MEIRFITYDEICITGERYYALMNHVYKMNYLCYRSVHKTLQNQVYLLQNRSGALQLLCYV